MIEINNLTKKLNKRLVLNNINCIFSDEIYGLVGPNGAGKTTLMRCLVGMYRVNKNNIIINGTDIRSNKVNIGYLPQSFGLFPNLSIMDSMRYFCNIKGISPSKDDIINCLKLVNMEMHISKKGKELSGGMTRRIGIAQALLGSPQIILLDEPTVGLDPEERVRFKKLLPQLKSNNTIIISTHIIEDVEACCDKIAIMNNGTINSISTPENLKKIVNNKTYTSLEEGYMYTIKKMDGED